MVTHPLHDIAIMVFGKSGAWQVIVFIANRPPVGVDLLRDADQRFMFISFHLLLASGVNGDWTQKRIIMQVGKLRSDTIPLGGWGQFSIGIVIGVVERGLQKRGWPDEASILIYIRTGICARHLRAGPIRSRHYLVTIGSDERELAQAGAQ
jgi:hypothetical protein